MRRICDVIGVCTAAAILIAGTSAPAFAGGFSRHHGHNFGHGHHGSHLSLRGDGAAAAAVILGLGFLTLFLSQPSARYEDPYAYRYRTPRYDRYRYRYPSRYPRSYVRPTPTIYAPPPVRRLQPQVVQRRIAQPRVAQLTPRAIPRALARAPARAQALRQFPAGCQMIREYRTQIHHAGRNLEAYGDKCLRADGSWIKGVPKLVPE